MNSQPVQLQDPPTESALVGDETIYDVCVVGIGISGLSAAISLLKQSKLIANSNTSDLRILLCERDSSLHNRRQGYGLTLTNSLTGPLAKLDLLEKCLERNCLSRSHFTFTPKGDILGYFGRIFPEESLKVVEEDNSMFAQRGGSRGNIRIPREELRNLMLRELINHSNQPSPRQLDLLNSLLIQRSCYLAKTCPAIDFNAGACEGDNQNNVQLNWGYKFLSYEESDEFVTSYFKVDADARITHGSIVSPDERIVSIKSRVLLGGDGINSKVRECRDRVLNFHGSSGLNYLGVTVIIGISEFQHPMLYEKGFYVLNGTHRLFTMPYYTPLEHNESGTEKPLVMWQLSFAGLTEADSSLLRKLSFSELLRYALGRVCGWFSPVPELLEATVLNEIWVTPLYDRDEMKVQCRFHPNNEIHHQRKTKVKETPSIDCDGKFDLDLLPQRMNTRVTVLGDACHPMSMFKGQGANQSLEDGILFANWILQDNWTESKLKRKRSPSPGVEKAGPLKSALKYVSRDQIYIKIRNFEREMVSKTFPKVLASRQSADHLHCSRLMEILQLNADFTRFSDIGANFADFPVRDYCYTINGLKDERQTEIVLLDCHRLGINAVNFPRGDLETKLKEVIGQEAKREGGR